MAPSRVRHAFTLVLLAAGYVAAGRLGLSLAFLHESASPVWPPTGLAIGALLVLGWRVWPAIAVGAFLVNLTTSNVAASSIAIAAGNTLEGIVGAWLATRFAGGRAAFDRTADILRFALAAAGASTIAASIGAAALVAAGLARPGDAGAIWFTWWLGDTVGAIVVTPVVIFSFRPSAAAWTARRAIEAAALAAALALAALFIFGPSPAGTARYPLDFVLVPLLLWSAFRLGARETAIASAAIVVVAVDGTLRGFGPFAGSSPNESLLLLQAFVGVTTTMMLSVAAEVSTRRAAERELRAVNDGLERRVAARTEELGAVKNRLVEAQQVAHVGSWEWDVPSNTLWWSEELFRIYGIDPHAAIGYETFLEAVHPDDRSFVDGMVRRAMADGQPFTFEHRIVRTDGTVRTLQAAGRVVRDSSGRAVRMMGIGHDVTERKQAEEERVALIQAQAARREAEEASRAKDDFLAVLSHELRTPLNAALGWAHTLRELPPGDARFARAVDAVYRNLLVQARLVSDILDVTRISRGTLVLDEGPVDLDAVIAAAIDMVRDAAAAREIEIQADGAPGAPDLTGDAKRLQQVLWNLLSNAVRFGRQGGRVRIAVCAGTDDILLTVEDDGPGIDPAFLPHVFEPFRQADPSPRRQHDGLGLGLAIARHLVELHGGTISACNAQHGGARFTIRLPARSAAGTS